MTKPRRKWTAAFGAATAIAALVLAFAVSWKVAVAIFLMQWSGNIDQQLKKESEAWDKEFARKFYERMRGNA